MPAVTDPEKIHFKSPTNDKFLEEVGKEVDEYFVRTNKSKAATWPVCVKGFAMIASCILLYCSLMFGWIPAVPRIILWAFIGVNQALLAANIAHDALHGAYSEKPFVNRILGFITFDMLGFSSYIWNQTHNRGHHMYTNICGADPDISKPGYLRLSPHDPHYKMHAFQQWYVWFFYAFIGVNWIFYADYAIVWEQRKKISFKDLAYFLFFKTFNFTFLLVLPLLFSPLTWWQVLLGHTCMQLAGGLTISVIFQLAHVVENLDFPMPDEKGFIEKPWGDHEMMTTSNFANHNPVLTQAIGGLNFQIEHHLFPKVSHAHFKAISPIVRKVAEKFGLPYHHQPTVASALASHTRTLKRFGSSENVC